MLEAQHQNESVKRLTKEYTIIRNFRGSWPAWAADLDNGDRVYIYIRYGELRIGVGKDIATAQDNSEVLAQGVDEYGGVVSGTTALVALGKAGFDYVAPSDMED